MFVFARHSAWKFTILELHLNPGRGLNSRPMKSTLLAVSVHRSDHSVMLLVKEDNSRFISILFFIWAILTCSTTLPRGNAVSPTTSCCNFDHEIARKIGDPPYLFCTTSIPFATYTFLRMFNQMSIISTGYVF